MSDLDTIVSVTITALTVTPDRAGFGVPLLLGFHTVFPERVREYAGGSAAVDMVADGFLTNDPLVRMARIVASQNPRPATIKIGRRATGSAQSINLTPTNTTEGFVYTFSVVSPDGIVTAVTFTNGAAETVATIVTALVALFTAIAGLTATDNTTDLDLDADTLGELFDIQTATLTRPGVDLIDNTPDSGIAADITAVELEDSDWYGTALDSNGKAEVAAAATSIEALTHIFTPTSADAEVLDDTAGNIAETLDVANLNRTALLWSGNVLSAAGAAWLGKNLPQDPGSITWAFKTLVGVAADNLTTTETSAVESNDANHYQRIAGVDITRLGTMASGQFIDVTRTIDAITARIQEGIFGLLVTLRKIPYTDKGVSLVKAEILGVLRDFQADGALDDAVEPVVTAPKVADIDTADIANRLLPDVSFTARLAGAIHSVVIDGTLTI